ncbi:MAG: hypothetical protein WA144_11740 [Candidatus Methanoperedens sp.]
MRTINKILISLGIIALIVITSIYLIGLLVSPGMDPLRFSIHNNDINKHLVTVEIFDSVNKSLFKETYEVNPKDEPIFSPKITEKNGEYTFKVALDDKIEKTYKAEVGVGKSGVSIWLYNENVSGSKDPIYIVQTVV